MRIERRRCASAFGLVALLAAPAWADAPSRQPGVYMKVPGKAGSAGFVRVPATLVTRTRQTGMFKVMLTSGLAKGNLIAVVDGERAATRAHGRSQSFRFQLGSEGTGAPADLMASPEALASMMSGGMMPPDAKNADQFVLVRFKLKGGNREVQIGTYGGHGASGDRSKDALPFTSQPAGAHAFVVTPNEPLASGEYAFYFGGGPQGFGGQVWDFGVD
jgi:hypothetical protein